ncbi:MAG: hypothetical protein HDR43_01055 [Mycoplasma sp.]|nr:hypothetical protein [Mycoplasma sp.]
MRKTGNDKDNINVLFLGDNYDRSDDLNKFANWMHKKVVIPWLSTPYPNDYDGKTSELTRGTRVPFQTFLNDKINVYSIQPNFKSNNTIVNSKNTFFGIHTSSKYGMLQMMSAGYKKSRILSYDISKNFLEDGGLVVDNTVGVIRNGSGGRANAPLNYLGTTLNSTSTHIHEMGHSIFGLKDEYDDDRQYHSDGINRVYLTDTNKENIPWKEFLDFRGVGLVQTKVPNSYIPASWCIMRQGGKTFIDFCEVCTHHIITTGAKITQNDLFYIADPQLTTNSRLHYPDNGYSTSYLIDQELNDSNVDIANNKKLDFKTVIDNLTSKTRKVKLKITIKNSNQENVFLEESQIYIIQPGELKGIELITKNKPSDLIKNNHHILGEVIDVENNEILATNRDRLNYYYLGDTDVIQDKDQKTYKVTINFLSKKTNAPLPNIKPTILIKRNNDKFKLNKILFNGYRLDKKLSKIDDKEIKISSKDLEFNYYYDELQWKELKLKLIDENDSSNVIQEKNVKVYEGQKFIPNSSDFSINNLNLYENDDFENINWQNSIVAPKWIYRYDQIDSNSSVIYHTSSKNPIYHLSKEMKIIQGQNINDLINSNIASSFFQRDYNSNFDIYEYKPRIIQNTTDTSKVGEYDLTYYYDNGNNINSLNNIKVKVISNNDPNYMPDPLQAEIDRLNSINIVSMHGLDYQDGTTEDFNAINENNLLFTILNFDLFEKNFNYQIVDFSKNIPKHDLPFYSFKFKIKISSKNPNRSLTTNFFEKYIWLKNSSSLRKFNIDDEINNEIKRINELNLALKKNEFTQEEINNINKINILSFIANWINNSKFGYEVINFTKNDNMFKFKIKISKDDKSATTNEIKFIYQLISSIKTIKSNDEILDKEIQRINNLNLELKNNLLLKKSDVENIIKQPESIIQYLNNWIPKNDLFQYKFLISDNDNNQMELIIQINKNGNKSFMSSKPFIFNYQSPRKNNFLKGNLPIILTSILIPILVVIICGGIIGANNTHKKTKKNNNK